MKNRLIGLFFASLWASASVATKIGLLSGEPFIIADVRFFIAGALMLFYAHIVQKEKIPPRHLWRPLAIFAFLNTTVYLGAFVIAIREISAGIGSLSIAVGPLFIIIISAIWLKRQPKWYELVGIVLGLAGAALAIWPLLANSHATLRGILIQTFGIISVSAASVYYAQIDWKISRLVFNGWQVLIGGLLLLPITIYFSDWNKTQWNLNFWLSVFWLIVPVSIISLQLWFYLLKQDAVKASMWLFLCPIFGFMYAAYFFDEPITWYTFVGTIFVMIGLYIAQLEKFSMTTISQTKNNRP